MSLVIPATFAEITFVLGCAGDASDSSISFGVSGVTTLADLEDAVDAANDGWTDPAGFGAGLSSTWTLLHTEGRTDPAGSNLFVDVDVNAVGAGGGNPLPSNCACLIRKVTGLGGRANRGRMYIPGLLGEADVDSNGFLDPTVLTNVGTNAVTLLAALTAAGNPMVVLHSDEVRDPAFPPPAKNMMPNPDTTPTPVTTLIVESQIGTQRRRMR